MQYSLQLLYHLTGGGGEIRPVVVKHFAFLKIFYYRTGHTHTPEKNFPTPSTPKKATKL